MPWNYSESFAWLGRENMTGVWGAEHKHKGMQHGGCVLIVIALRSKKGTSHPSRKG